ncbi:MAG: homocysteine S-methyltransferase family protein, partial [Propionibacteriaceae bacterium]|nr:homocysteine S-methyltransferase family protein [Propionibacteriaceae bacterium]
MTFRSVLGATLLLGDGAMGTMIQNAALDDTAFDGHSGCNDVLNLTSPGVISEIHAQYLGAGADWIETNTFGANPTALADYNLAHAIADINLAGAQLARRAADQASTPSWPRYVVGSMGPGTKLPTLGQSSFTELRDAYQVAAAALIAGGVDALQVETCQDLLQAKAAIVGARRAVQAQGRDVPVIACVTIEANGAMLLGTPVDAAVAALRHMRIDALGLNCATGPDLMAQPLRTLSRCCPLPIIAMPNAGLPQMTADGLRYTLSPADFAQAMADFAQRFGLASVAGCCGTTPAHIGAARDAIGPARP